MKNQLAEKYTKREEHRLVYSSLVSFLVITREDLEVLTKGKKSQNYATGK